MTKSISFHPGISADQNVEGTLDFAKPFRPQVEAMIDRAGPALLEADEVCLPGQAVATALMLPAIEMSAGFPTMTLYGFGRDAGRLGTLDLEDYRHNVVRPRRADVPEGKAYEGYTVLDGAGRGLEPFQIEELADALGTEPENIRVLNIGMGQIDPANPTKGVANTLVESGLTKADLTSGRIIYVPAGFGPLSTVILTAIYGLTETWPRTVRFNRHDDGSFHVEEVVDPQAMRQWGTAKRSEWTQSNLTENLASLAKMLRVEYGIGADVEGTTFTVAFPDGEAFDLSVSSVAHYPVDPGNIGS